MTMPPLPGLGTTNWMDWAAGVHEAAEAVTEGRLTDAELRAEFRTSVHVRDHGAVGDETTDDTDAINTAITAAGGTTSGTVVLDDHTYLINGRVTVPDGISLVGQGGNANSGFAATTLLCGAAGAGVTVNGSGGHLSDLHVDGNSVSTQPLLVTLGANRFFERVEVRYAAQDNITIEKAQNAVWIGCASDNAGRDCLVIDQGAGGTQFLRFNASDPGRHCIRFDQTTTSPEVYPEPHHISFAHSMLERPASDNALVKFNAGFNVTFHTSNFAGDASQTTAPLIDAAAVGWLTLDNCEYYGETAGQVAIEVSSGSSVSLNGTNRVMSGVGFFLDNPAGLVQVNGDVFLGGSTAFATGATPVDSTVLRQFRNTQFTTRDGQFDVVQAHAVSGEAGQRFRLLANGQLQGGAGADYSFPNTMYRRSDGKVGIDNGLVVNGGYTVTGSQGGNAALASLLAALASAGLITDSTTA